MNIRQIFASLFARPEPPSFSPDLPDAETGTLAAEMQACLNRSGGALTTIRRTQAVATLFSGLSAEGKRRYVDTIRSLNDTGGKSVSDRYSEIEEAELFGGSASKLAMLDAFETPVRRMLAALNGTENGAALIAEIRDFGDEELTREIHNL
jgi:hypothetical protein